MTRTGTIVLGWLILTGLGCKSKWSNHVSTHASHRVQNRKISGSSVRHPILKRTVHAPLKRRVSPPIRRPELPRRCIISQKMWSWYQRAQLTADRDSLAQMYRKQRYRIPHATRTMMLATRVVRGVGQPAFQVYSLGNTGFRFSHGKRRWWPASCIKPWAVVGALMTLHAHGLNGRTRLVFRDQYGLFKGTLWNLYIDISNERYDRMMTIAGLDQLNSIQRRKKYGYPHLIVQRTYGAMRSARRSPKIYYTHKGKKGVIPVRYAKRRYASCKSNCTTLFELQDVLRRTVLHDELPANERFTIASDDARRIKRAYLKVPNKMGRAFRKVWGRRSKGYNKSGSARGWDQIENVFIEPQRSPYRYLIAGSVPWWRPHYMATPSLKKLNRLGEYTMRALDRLSSRRVSLQMDAGQSMKIRITAAHKTSKRWRVDILALGIQRLDAWLQTQALRIHRIKKGHFRIDLEQLRPGKQLLTLQGYKDSKAVSYRSVGFEYPAQFKTQKCRP